MKNAKKRRKTIEWENQRSLQWNIICKDGHSKGQYGKDLTEAEEIKKRWQEYTRTTQKMFNDWVNHDGVVTHPEPDTMECEVK